jgi:hypothetical protein
MSPIRDHLPGQVSRTERANAAHSKRFPASAARRHAAKRLECGIFRRFGVLAQPHLSVQMVELPSGK